MIIPGFIIVMGALIGGAVHAILYPFDLLKTQMQMHNELVKERKQWRIANQKTYAYRVLQTMRALGHHDHFRTISVSIMPMYLIGCFATGLRTFSYQFAYHSEFLSTEKQDVLKPRAILFCGIIGSIAQLIINPFNLMKTKLQYWVLCESSLTRNVMRKITFLQIGKILHQKFGSKIFTVGWGCSIYRGFIANIAQMIIYNLILLEVDFCEHRYFKLTEKERDFARIFSAIMAGAVSTFCVSPFDVVLTRLHTQPYMINMRGLYYSGFRDASYKIIKNEGYHGLFKGSAFLWLRHGVGATTNIFFWDRWKDHDWLAVGSQNAPAFIEQYYVGYCFESGNLF